MKRIWREDDLKNNLDVSSVHGRIELMKNEIEKKYFYIKYNYNHEDEGNIQTVGMFDDFCDIEEEMIEVVMDNKNKIKIYLCENIKRISQDDNKKVMAGAFLEPKEFFKKNFKDEYKDFCKKYKLLLN